MTRERRLTPAEYRAWRAVARSIRALHPVGEVESEPASVKPAPKTPVPVTPAPQTSRNPPKTATNPTQTAVKPTSNPPPTHLVMRDKPSYTPMGPADRSGEKKVRRGQSEVHAILDLHGHTQVGATRELSAFLQRERSRGARCVLVITGKGRGGEGVLRRRFVEWLETPSTRHSVSGYAPAHPRHGGEGAFYLFLRRQKDE